MKPFHITLGVATEGKLSLDKEIGLLKAGILYGDRVTLGSLTCPMVLATLAMTQLKLDERLDFLASVVPAIRPDLDRVNQEKMVQHYKRLGRQKHKSRSELQDWLGLKEILTEGWADLQERVLAIIDEAQVSEVLCALQSGFVELLALEHLDDTSLAVEEFVTAAVNAIGNLDTYPLFDERLGGLIRSGLEKGVFTTGPDGRERARILGLASGLIRDLPLFDLATMSEVIDIRRELEKPLVRFRSAIVELSESVAHEAWDEGFQYDVDKVLQRDVAPAVLEIGEACKTNTYLRTFLRGVQRNVTVLGGMSTLGMFMGQVTPLSEATSTAIGAATGSVLASADAYREWRDKRHEIESNRFFFYYKAQKLLQQ